MYQTKLFTGNECNLQRSTSCEIETWKSFCERLYVFFFSDTVERLLPSSQINYLSNDPVVIKRGSGFFRRCILLRNSKYRIWDTTNLYSSSSTTLVIRPSKWQKVCNQLVQNLLKKPASHLLNLRPILLY